MEHLQNKQTNKKSPEHKVKQVYGYMLNLTKWTKL